MTTTFLRLLDSPVPAKGDDLRAQVAALNAGRPGEESFLVLPDAFAVIPGTPFAYWAKAEIRNLFEKMPSISDSGISAQHGASSKNDFRFLRLWWEPDTESKRWTPFAKGGQYAPYFSDVFLENNRENEAQEIRECLVHQYPYLWD